MTQKILNTSSKIAIVVNTFDINSNIKKLLDKLKDYEIVIYCYNSVEKTGYPVFFINHIINVYDNIIACDILAAKKCEKFKRHYTYIDINNTEEIEKIGT